MRLILVFMLCLSLKGMAQPEINFGNMRIDVGVISQRPEYQLTWYFKNTGNESLVITGVKTGESILVVKGYDKGPIVPGAQGRIDAVLDTRNWTNAPFNKSLAVRTNAGKEILLSATGFVGAVDSLASSNIPGSFTNVDSRPVTSVGSDVFYNIQPGDILFQDLDCGAACDAIEAVTEGALGRDFSHCGIVVQMGNDMMVVEAYGAVRATPVDSFISRSKDARGEPRVLIGRLKDDKSMLAEESAELAKKYIGKEYDDAFDLENDKYYCSELVYECFKKANSSKPFFQLNKMTFKEPGTDVIQPFWIDYFKKLDTPVPEGKPGINPGAMSRSEKLQILPLQHL